MADPDLVWFKLEVSTRRSSRASFCLYEWVGKGGSHWIAKSLWGRRSPNFWAIQSCFFSSNWFFEGEHPFIDKPKVITEPPVPRARILGLDWKLYFNNKQHILNKNLTWMIQSLTRVPKNWAKQRKKKKRKGAPVSGRSSSKVVKW